MFRIIQTNLTFFLILWSLTSQAQERPYFIGEGEARLHKLEEKAQNAFESKNYYGAYGLYRKALKIDSTNVINQYKLAESAEAYGAYCIAADAYDRVLEIDDQYPNALNKYTLMQERREQISSADRSLQEIDQRILASKNIPDESQYFPRKLDFINTGFAELNPVWRNDSLYYGSLAFFKKKKAKQPRRMYAKTLKSDLKSNPVDWELNIENTSTAHLTYSKNGRRVYFTICDYNKKSEIICQIYYRDQLDTIKNIWTAPIALPSSINHKNYTSTQPSIGKDNAGNQVLYFVTNRPKSNCDCSTTNSSCQCQMDIWYTRIIDKDSFSAPTPLGVSVNSRFNEISPFYHFSSNSLYFSSDNPSGYGGYDIYKIENGMKKGWRNLERLEIPTNSGADD